jgi:hypothetical protein
VWGTERWINVSLRYHHPIQLSSLPSDSAWATLHAAHRLADLKVIVSAPIIGMSDSKQLPTLQFIGGLVSVWGTFPLVLQSHEEDPDFERRLNSLASMKARWTAFSHRALPMWMAGTYQLSRALAESEPQMGSLVCALGSFEAAHNQLRPGDNPELEIAIMNNQAIGYLAKAAFGSSPKVSRAAALALLKRAAVAAQALPHDPGRHAALYDVVWSNLSLVKKAHGKHKRKH